MPIEGIDLDNVTLSSATGVECIDATRIRMRNIHILPEKGPVFRIDNGTDILIEKARFPEGAEVFLKLEGEKTAGIRITDTTGSKAKKEIEFGKGASARAISK